MRILWETIEIGLYLFWSIVRFLGEIVVWTGILILLLGVCWILFVGILTSVMANDFFIASMAILTLVVFITALVYVVVPMFWEITAVKCLCSFVKSFKGD